MEHDILKLKAIDWEKYFQVSGISQDLYLESMMLYICH